MAAVGLFLAVNAKCMFLNRNSMFASYRLGTTVLILNGHCGKIQNIFLTSITAAVSFQPSWTSMSQSWNRSGSQAPVRPDRTRPDETGFLPDFFAGFLPDFCQCDVKNEPDGFLPD